jgi:YggT family protein
MLPPIVPVGPEVPESRHLDVAMEMELPPSTPMPEASRERRLAKPMAVEEKAKSHAVECGCQMSVFLFLVNTLFFVLVAAALLRAWLNFLRIAMWRQPGPFVLALTDWMVKPLRRGLPDSWRSSRRDLASLVTAVLLALLQALVLVSAGAWGSGQSGLGPVALMALPALALKILLVAVFKVSLYLTLGYAILSWVQPHSPVWAWLDQVVGPVLGFIRRFVPLVGGVDLSPVVLVLLLQIASMVLG